MPHFPTTSGTSPNPDHRPALPAITSAPFSAKPSTLHPSPGLNLTNSVTLEPKHPGWAKYVLAQAAEIVKSYWKAELFGTAVSLGAAAIAQSYTDHRGVVSYAASLAENFAFYGVLIAQRDRLFVSEMRALGQNPSILDRVKRGGKILRSVVTVELFDSCLLRPACLWAGQAVAMTGNPESKLAALGGLVVGKFMAEPIFFTIFHFIEKYFGTNEKAKPATSAVPDQRSRNSRAVFS